MYTLWIQKTKKQLEKIEEEEKLEVKKVEKAKPEKKWYEKFRWFTSSEGFLCIGGRDATTNEIVIKKHTNPDDLVFHTEIPGSPFFVIKTEGKKPGQETLLETAQATASYSRAWKLETSFADVFWVNPSQVSKEALPGEFIAKGAFMVYGKKNTITAKLEIAIGTKGELTIGGPVDAVKENSDKFVIVQIGQDKASDIAKKIKSKIGGDVNDIIRFLPSGKFSLKWRKIKKKFLK